MESASWHASGAKNFEAVPRSVENFFIPVIFVEGLKMLQNIFVTTGVMHSNVGLKNTKQDTEKSTAVLNRKIEKKKKIISKGQKF
jgi:hypothetical protein